MTGCKLHACNWLAGCFSKCFLNQQHPHSPGTKCKFSDSLSKLLSSDFWGWGPETGILLQYSCLENPVDGGAWWAAVHRVAQSRTQLRRLSMHACMHAYSPWGRKELDMTERFSHFHIFTYVKIFSNFPLDFFLDPLLL